MKKYENQQNLKGIMVENFYISIEGYDLLVVAVNN